MKDVCCWACRSPTGVCLSRYQCDHHRVAQAQDEADHHTRRTYANPTQDRAIGNVMREQERRKPR